MRDSSMFSATRFTAFKFTAFKFTALAALCFSALGCQTTSTPNVSPSNSASSFAKPQEDSEARKKAKVRLELAANYMLQKQYKYALEEFENALRIDPGWAEVYAAYGALYLELGDPVQAEKLFQKGLSFEPSNVSVNLNYGWFLCMSGRYDDAIKYSLQATKNPWQANRNRGWQNAGVCALTNKKYTQAEEYLLLAFEAEPRNPVVIFSLAKLFFNLKQAERAKYFIELMGQYFEPNAEVLWLHIKIMRATSDKGMVLKLSQDLKTKFPASREASLLLRGSIDDE